MNAVYDGLRTALTHRVVGQRHVVESLIVAVLCSGHILLEGPPGVAKTLSCRVLAAALDAEFKRIQFTADLLPSDIVGTRIFEQRHGNFATVLGPIFANLVLADEINRAPAKVQSALLEAMQERQVTIGPHTYALPEPFIVMATMNPVDADGTYALPFAQCDRFLMKVELSYPTTEQELEILERYGAGDVSPIAPVATLNDLRDSRRQVADVHVASQIRRYIVELVAMTRKPSEFIDYGASPRATLALGAVARALAFINGRDFVIPDDVRSLASNVLRHRVQFNERALAEGIRSGEFVENLIAAVPPP